VFGSGTLSVPCVPYTSILGRLAAHTSKVTMTVAIPPAAKSRMPTAWVATSTSIALPYLPSLVIVRVGKLAAVEPVTRRTGPMSETSAVM